MKYTENDIVIINTGGKDSFGHISKGLCFHKQDVNGDFVYKRNKKGFYWKEQDCYLIRFENSTRQYIPAKYIRKALTN